MHHKYFFPQKFFSVLVVFFVLFSSVSSLFSISKVHAEEPSTCEVEVRGDTVECYDNINDAVNAAQPGDEIYVKVGTYIPQSTIEINVGLDFVCEDGVVIDGDGADEGFHIYTENVSITGCEITNFATAIIVDLGFFPGTDATTIRINNNKFHDNLDYAILYPWSFAVDQVDARYNDWGTDFGPIDYSTTDGSYPLVNLTGKGDVVNGAINYLYWIDAVPEVTIISPLQDAFLSGQVTVATEAYDEDGMGAYRMILRKDSPDTGTLMWQCSWNDGGNDYFDEYAYRECNFQADSFPDGVYWLTVEYLDGDPIPQWGSAQIRVMIDRVAPVAELTSQNNGDVLKGSVNISGTVFDLNNEKYSLDVLDKKGNLVMELGEFEDQSSLTNVSFDWDTTNIPNGKYKIRLTAVDGAGNSSPVDSVDLVKVKVKNVATISGYVWKDKDGDGQWDKAEKPVRYKKVSLNNGQLKTKTNKKGHYKFKNLPLGTYFVCLSLNGPAIQTYPQEGCSKITLDTSEQIVSNTNFGFAKPKK